MGMVVVVVLLLGIIDSWGQYSLARSLTHSFTHSFTRSINRLIHAFTQSFITSGKQASTNANQVSIPARHMHHITLTD
jgi:hypothetical protein